MQPKIKVTETTGKLSDLYSSLELGITLFTFITSFAFIFYFLGYIHILNYLRTLGVDYAFLDYTYTDYITFGFINNIYFFTLTPLVLLFNHLFVNLHKKKDRNPKVISLFLSIYLYRIPYLIRNLIILLIITLAVSLLPRIINYTSFYIEALIQLIAVLIVVVFDLIDTYMNTNNLYSVFKYPVYLVLLILWLALYSGFSGIFDANVRQKQNNFTKYSVTLSDSKKLYLDYVYYGKNMFIFYDNMKIIIIPKEEVKILVKLD